MGAVTGVVTAGKVGAESPLWSSELEEDDEDEEEEAFFWVTTGAPGWWKVGRASLCSTRVPVVVGVGVA